MSIIVCDEYEWFVVVHIVCSFQDAKIMKAERIAKFILIMSRCILSYEKVVKNGDVGNVKNLTFLQDNFVFSGNCCSIASENSKNVKYDIRVKQ